MKVEKILTSDVILFYYSRKGNTKALVNLFKGKCVIARIEDIDKYDLNEYSTVIFATSTYGRGVPPLEFHKHKDIILNHICVEIILKELMDGMN